MKVSVHKAIMVDEQTVLSLGPEKKLLERKEVIFPLKDPLLLKRARKNVSVTAVVEQLVPCFSSHSILCPLQGGLSPV